MKTLKPKQNETAEEGFQRKAKVLDRLYVQCQHISKILNLDQKSIMHNITELIEEFNQISIDEND